ncbi:MAG: cell division protein SepF [Bifidobacteriaceae bacterium]|nr:cell division protein SepF [Bifidobacteriaceae bacterium]
MAGLMQTAKRKLGFPVEADDEDYYYDDYEGAGEAIADVTPIHAARASAHLTVAEPTHRIETAHPRNWADAKKIGLAYRESVPVIINLSHVNDADAQRLVDFASGMALAMRGRMQRITNQVFLLSPATLTTSEITGDSSRRFEDD